MPEKLFPYLQGDTDSMLMARHAGVRKALDNDDLLSLAERQIAYLGDPVLSPVSFYGVREQRIWEIYLNEVEALLTERKLKFTPISLERQGKA